ncbi:putative Ran GTPase-activating protein 1 [Hypsibius exemplaris]|uniref:Ran GTPase-activating protein 1 n=1 Tax=Hypsibius exemplaris TaxID=2072580 RepID=A0A1W0WDZ0_HYPEX|nr:putative Ran GTPase-activating protein 1 [Hypsibius exemplaris]
MSTSNVVRLSDHVPEKSIQFDKPDDIESFLSFMRSSNQIHTLHLSHISIGKDVAVAIGNALANHGELQELHMVAAFKGRQIEEVVQCLEAISEGVARSGCQLRVIDISENAFRGTGIRGMSAVLTGRASFKLEELKMSDQGLSPEGGQVLGKLLKELQENAALVGQELVLRSFKASKNRLENGGASALGKVFANIKTLEEVEVYQCGINAPGLTDLLHGLSASRGLRVLDILDNTCNAKAEKALADAIKSWSKLEDLRINSCLITDKGMLAVLFSLRTNCPSLKILDMGENSVEGAVEEQVLEHLSAMPSLESVVLSGNEFYGKKRVKELFHMRFVEIGKPNAIKKQLDGGHTYGLAGEDDEEEGSDDEEAEGSENDNGAAESDKETGEVSHLSAVDDVAEGEEEDGDTLPPFQYILEAKGDSMWTVSYPDAWTAGHKGSDTDVELFGHRLEQNCFYQTLGYFVTQTWESFEAKNYRDVVTRLAGRAFECMEERAGDENEYRSIKADHELDAILQFAEYLVACASVQVGSGLFEEFFRSMGLVSGKWSVRLWEL